MITSTDQRRAAVVKIGLITICVLLNELATWFGKIWPAVRSRSVILAPLTKLLPLIVNGCALFDPVTLFGLTLLIEGAADSFLHQMVRIVAGSLVDVGRGRLSAQSMSDVLLSKRRDAAGLTAPAHGLCLERVHFAEPL